MASHLALFLPGGFAGVDIFFTISGFLIGSIILGETSAGAFSFSAFYARRIRRIFPALFAMMLATSIVAYRVLLPAELMGFANSMAAAGLSASNFYFWSQSGYFDQIGLSKPLLHTWSLGVEEQFYLLLPIVLVLLRRFMARRVELGIYLLAAISFVFSIYGTARYPTAAFFFPHTRAWELLLGVMLALDRFPRIHRPALRNIAGVIGIALIVAAGLLYRAWTPYPGFAALAPCCGAALMIAAGRTGPHIIGRALSITPMRFIGRISYSLYLWHWPVIAGAKFGITYWSGLSVHASQALLFAISMILAALSWRFIEVPFRSGAFTAGRRSTFAGAAAAIATVSVIAVAIHNSHGAPQRFSPREVEIASYLYGDPHDHRDQNRYGICFIDSAKSTAKDFAIPVCLPDRPREKKLLVMGDSHAAALWFGLDQVLAGVNVMQATGVGCRPAIHQPPQQDGECAKVMDYIWNEYLPSHSGVTVLLQARWYAMDIALLDQTLAFLRERNIPAIVIGPVPMYDTHLPRLLAMSLRDRDPELPRRHRIGAIDEMDRQMAARARDVWHVRYVSLVDLLCPQGTCIQFAAPDVPLLSDADHFTKAGSILAAQKIAALGILLP